ncbi:hypothetical protein PR002_g28398 [Phytophthora rubi]|uniref:Polyprotein n=1 Tax=Phytophthora rubi TaxID=129364 RepID=A0A6A3HCF5_9STRA|nr:hypothetical protein PR002_g28398 [Phytophthora rubi]
MEVLVPRWQPDLLAPVLYAHFNATTTNGDSRLILISLHVAGAERPLRALLDSAATNNFIRDDCLALLPPHVRVREGPGEIVVKLADGKPHRAPRRAVSLAYAFDGFSTNDDFLAIELNYAFDCILGMPWLARYQPEIDCRGSDIHDPTPTTRERWPSLCGVRGLRHWSSQQPPSRAREGLKRNTVEQWLPYENYAVEQGLPHVKNAVEQRLPPVLNAVEMRFPHVKNAVEQRLPLENATVEQRLPFADDSVAQQDLRDTGMVESELPCLEEGEVPSSESSSSVTSTSSSGSRRLRKSKRNRSGRRRLRRRSTAVDQAPSSEILNVVEYSEGSPNQVRAIEVANPPTDAATITRLPGLPWKHFLRDLKAGEIEQVCLLTGSNPTCLPTQSATTPRRRDRRRLSRNPFARHASPRSLGRPSKTRTTPSTRLHASSKTSSPRRFRRNFLLSEASGTRSTSCPGRSTA